jgi:CheY-like chemotaxis protein
MTAVASILILDDDADYRASLRSILESEGYRVVTASSGREGLAMVGEHRPDVIVLDVMMESSTEGYAVSFAMQFGPEARDTPIVMVSSIEASPDELFARSGEVGLIRPTHYLTKPLDIPRFLEVLARLTGQRVRA